VGSPWRRAGPWLFAVEDTAVQVSWPRATTGPLLVDVEGTRVEVPVADPDAPGAFDLDGLAPGARVEVVGGTGRGPARARTLAPPPGEELFRFATISDLHIGERSFGMRSTIVERPRPEEHHPERSTRAALRELRAWGAAALVVKGDVTHGGKARQWDRFAALIDGVEIPLVVIPGNHDTGEGPGALRRLRAGEGPTDRQPPLPIAAARARVGLDPAGPVQVLDVPGLRIVAATTSVPGQRAGRLDLVTAEVAERAAEVDTPVFVALHHQLLTLPVPHHPPPGVPANQSQHFLDTLLAANPAAFVTSGHTHRHRRRTHATAVITEVGSPKDFPGTWAGYVVHEGGIRQVVRRVADPDILRWTDRTAAAALGAWGEWSPGTLDARCFSHTWPEKAPTGRP
jgi:Icc protein